MENIIPFNRLLHFIGLGLLFGGTLSSIVLMRLQKPNAHIAKLALKLMHILAAPGLVLLTLTGFIQSWALYFEPFKGAGFMHAKLLFVLGLFVLLFLDIKTQKKILRNNEDSGVVVSMVKKRQAIAFMTCLTILIVMWLISFRPF